MFSKKNWQLCGRSNTALSPWLYQSWYFLLRFRPFHTLTTRIGRNVRPWRRSVTSINQKMWQTVYLPACIGKGVPQRKMPTTRYISAPKWLLFVLWIWKTMFLDRKSARLYSSEIIPKIGRPNDSSTKFRIKLRPALRSDCLLERRN